MDNSSNFSNLNSLSEDVERNFYAVNDKQQSKILTSSLRETLRISRKIRSLTSDLNSCINCSCYEGKPYPDPQHKPRPCLTGLNCKLCLINVQKDLKSKSELLLKELENILDIWHDTTTSFLQRKRHLQSPKTLEDALAILRKLEWTQASVDQTR